MTITRNDLTAIVRRSIRVPFSPEERAALLAIARTAKKVAFGSEWVAGVGCVRAQAEEAFGLKLGGFGRTFDNLMAARMGVEPTASGVVEVV
jgi:hypothetical protein